MDVYEDQKLIMPDGTPTDAAGRRMARDGDTLVISAYREDIDYVRQGAAYIYQWNGSSWEFYQKLVSITPANYEAFASSVAVHGDTMIIGNRGDSEFLWDGGAAWIYYRIEGVWTLSQKLVAPDITENLDFGVAVEISGDILVVGGRNNIAAVDSGILYVYQYDHESAEFVFIQRILPDEVTTSYEYALWDAVAISGTTLAVGGEGAPNAQGDLVGAVHVYEFDGAQFQQTAKLMHPDSQAGDRYGGALAIDGDFIMVGSLYHDSGAGAVFVYSKEAPYDLLQTLVPQNQEADHRFGSSVKADSGTVAIGGDRANGVTRNTGAAHLFVLDTGTSQWVEVAE